MVSVWVVQIIYNGRKMYRREDEGQFQFLFDFLYRNLDI